MRKASASRAGTRPWPLCQLWLCYLVQHCQSELPASFFQAKGGRLRKSSILPMRACVYVRTYGVFPDVVSLFVHLSEDQPSCSIFSAI